ncbi:POT family-domain-containing protein [Absidia repens]|uniref:POT family-domain-containing protein n=1 Tax=Absidia repens TaxID=90262 RepID=A0A1X2I308_9FUNG|nr:POT family-domain-containing protein [Absidia repens]
MSDKMEGKNTAYDESSLVDSHDYDAHDGELFGPEPTEEEWKTLPEVSDFIPKAAYLVILVEFCERFTYYGLSGPFQNYIQYPDPPSYPAAQPGALGRGQQTATALTTFFQFWCYITPAIISDQYLGKYKTIVLFAGIYFIGLVILTSTATPAAITNGAAFPGLVVSLIIIGLGTGGIKSNVSPLVAEQYTAKTPYTKTLKNGKMVIVTPQATYQKIFNMFYWGINVGSLSAIATTELEKNVGFWPAFLLPLCMFVPCMVIVILGRKQYIQNPPRGSVFLEAGRLFVMTFKVKGGMEACKPSNLIHTHPELIPKATWDDIFVDELRRTLRACVVFCWFPIYWLCYSQMTNNLVSMAGTMQTGNVPNDIMQNIDPICLIIFIPIMDAVIYPFLRRIGLPMRPMVRISCGFFFAAVAMGYSAGVQSMAPQSMKSIVMALFLLTNCFASILGFALVSVAVDPKLKWMYTGISITAGVCCVLFYVCHHKNDQTDKEEDAIIRSDSQMEEYKENQHVVTTAEYEAEKGTV